MHNNTIKFLERFFNSNTIFKYGFNFNPAYRRSSGRVYFVSDDLHTVKIKIPLSFKNKNYGHEKNIEFFPHGKTVSAFLYKKL